MKSILPLEQAQAEDGPKVHWLARLQGMGLPVARGFLVRRKNVDPERLAQACADLSCCQWVVRSTLLGATGLCRARNFAEVQAAIKAIPESVLVQEWLTGDYHRSRSVYCDTPLELEWLGTSLIQATPQSLWLQQLRSLREVEARRLGESSALGWQGLDLPQHPTPMTWSLWKLLDREDRLQLWFGRPYIASQGRAERSQGVFRVSWMARWRRETRLLLGARQVAQELIPLVRVRLQAMALENLEVLGELELLERLRSLVRWLLEERGQEWLELEAFCCDLGSAADKPGAQVGSWFLSWLSGDLGPGQLLAQIGHRGLQELELSQPRWRELPPEQLWHSLEKCSPPSSCSQRGSGLAATWIGLRQQLRHWMLLGWAEIRRTLLVLDKLRGGEGEIFFQTFEELCERPAWYSLSSRRRDWRLFQELEVSSSLAAAKSPVEEQVVEAFPGQHFWGRPLLEGWGEGAVVHWGGEVPASGDFVLLAKSLDVGAWPTVARAKALLVELAQPWSEITVIAAQLGLPLVAELGGQHFSPGQWLQVNGLTGTVLLCR